MQVSPIEILNQLEQKPGCLPPGFDLDSMLTPEQFCIWQGVSRDWLSARVETMKGIIAHSRQVIRIHPRSFLERNVK